MNKSRLEKFLYALYSLDSSDLPTPLSRIEELYKCWVTGEEAPTFKPLSRVEKYLMAILGTYNVDELPNPISRVEVLLYKLATGDDNLDDVEIFLSEHEELLAEIIRNGGAGGNIDVEHVLYTLSTEFNTLCNTAEKPVKSAILKGQTLVNVHPTNYIVTGSNPTFFLSKIIPKTMIKPNTRYFLRLYNTHQSVVSAYFKPCVENRVDLISSDNKCAIFTTKSEFEDSDFNNNKIHFYSSSNLTLEDVKDTKVILCEYIDGMENWDIPYFEGMQSTKMPVLKTTGKNLFNVETVKKGYTLSSETGLETEKSKRYISDFIYVKGLTHLAITNPERTQNIWGYDEDKQPITKVTENGKNGTFVVSIPSNIVYIRIPFSTRDNDTTITDEIIQNNLIQIEEGSVATEYEPYKSTTVTCNEEVELRGIGEVKDELDLVTGEVTRRIEEYTELSNQGCATSNYYQLDGHTTFTFGDWSNKIKPNVSSIFSNKLPYPTQSEGVIYDNHSLYIRIKNDKLTTLDSEGLKEWIIKEHFTITFPMKTETVKTVDLSVADQDGNNTKLSTFDDITHVTLSSEGLIPEAEMEVATKNEEVLSTLSLEMDDISTAQTTLEETSNTQSENVDATMIATTEIYEGLL